MSDTKRERKIGTGMLTNAAGILASRVTGLARDICFAKFWGTGDALGSFFIAFTIPNLFRRVFGEGAVGEATIPLFTEKLIQSGRRDAYLFVSNVISVIGLILLAVVGVGIGVTIMLRSHISGELATYTITLLPYLLPYTFFICVVGILGAVLQSQRQFTVPAVTPIILNVAFIVGVIYICPRFGTDEITRLKALAVTVVLAGLLQLAVLIPALLRLGFFFKFIPRFRSPDIDSLRRLVLPGLFGASANQVNVLCDRLFAGFLGGYAVTSLYYSERIIYLPVGVFAVALSTACLPELSRAVAKGRTDEMISATVYSLRIVLYLTLPSVILIVLLAEPIINVLYARGSFDQESVRNTVAALLYYAPGIPAFAAVKILRSGFYSRKDILTPVRIGFCCLIVNIVLNVILMVPLQHRGLALATTISSYVNVCALAVMSWRQFRSHGIPLMSLWLSLSRIVVGLLFAGVAVQLIVNQFSFPIDSTLAQRLAHVFIPAVGGVVVFVALTAAMGSREPTELASHLTFRSNEE